MATFMLKDSYIWQMKSGEAWCIFIEDDADKDTEDFLLETWSPVWKTCRSEAECDTYLLLRWGKTLADLHVGDREIKHNDIVQYLYVIYFADLVDVQDS